MGLAWRHRPMLFRRPPKRNPGTTAARDAESLPATGAPFRWQNDSIVPCSRSRFCRQLVVQGNGVPQEAAKRAFALLNPPENPTLLAGLK
jgi:hypothetical protein